MADETVLVTKEFMERNSTERGAWTRAQLALLGVAWPPPKGWRRRIEGLLFIRQEVAEQFAKASGRDADKGEREMSEKPGEQAMVPAPTWAVVELMGHVKHAGRLSEEERFGCKLGRLDSPNDDGTETTIYFGGASVFRITVVTETVARHVARTAPARPVSPWDFPKQLPAPEAADPTERSYAEIGNDYPDDDEEPSDFVDTNPYPQG